MIQTGDKVIDKKTGRRYAVMSVTEDTCKVALIIEGRVIEEYVKKLDEVRRDGIDESHDLGDVSDNEIFKSNM